MAVVCEQLADIGAIQDHKQALDSVLTVDTRLGVIQHCFKIVRYYAKCRVDEHDLFHAIADVDRLDLQPRVFPRI